MSERDEPPPPPDDRGGSPAEALVDEATGFRIRRSVDEVDVRELLRSALQPPPGAVAPKVVRGVQRRSGRARAASSTATVGASRGRRESTYLMPQPACHVVDPRRLCPCDPLGLGGAGLEGGRVGERALHAALRKACAARGACPDSTGATALERRVQPSARMKPPIRVRNLMSRPVTVVRNDDTLGVAALAMFAGIPTTCRSSIRRLRSSGSSRDTICRSPTAGTGASAT